MRNAISHTQTNFMWNGMLAVLILNYFLTLTGGAMSSLISRVQSDASRLPAMTTRPNKIATTLLVDEQASKKEFPQRAPASALWSVYYDSMVRYNQMRIYI